MAIQKTEAVVLKTIPFRSSSLIITFYSREFGKMKGIVKGVRKERENRIALYELFTHLEIVFYEKRSDLHLVSDAYMISSFDSIRTKLQAITYASYFSELVDALTEVFDPHPMIFDLLLFSFKFLSSLNEEHLARIFEVHLLKEVGMLPYLDGCLKCRTTAFESGFFSIVQGALVCSKCAGAFPDARRISKESLEMLRYLSRHNAEESIRKRVSDEGMREIQDLVERFLNFRLSRPLKTRQFMKSIQSAVQV